jgi:ABC-type branched-subunit amino acid transport system ATPase component
MGNRAWGGEPLIIRDLVRVCSERAAAGQTIVLVEQNLAATLALASRVYIINNGTSRTRAPPRRFAPGRKCCSATSAYRLARPTGSP